jgi:hypothetical protein
VLEPVQVWKVDLVRGRPPVDIAGTLTIGDDALVFERADGAGTVRIAFTDAAGAKRLRGSPVMVVRRMERAAGSVAFYFAEPPPLRPADPATVPLSQSGPPSPFAGLRRSSQRRHNRRNAGYLTSRSKELRPAVQAWTSLVRVKIEEARRAG